MIRKGLLAGVAVSCLFAGQGAYAGPPAPPTGSLVAATDGPVQQFYGNINPFYGNINPFYGNISPFYGNINPFYGNISPFWGNINPFWGNINPFYGNINPFYGNINPFWGNISPFSGPNAQLWGNISPFWQSMGPTWGNLDRNWAALQSSNATDYSSIQSALNSFVSQNAAFWGPTVLTGPNKKSDFNTVFAAPLFAKYGINPNDPASLATASEETRSEFFLAWYDGLMSYAGAPHVDWWMGAVDWTPALTQIQGLAKNNTVGILDAAFGTGQSGGPQSSGGIKVKFVGGYNYFVNAHGAAVASLIASPASSNGVLGIAPNSTIDVYNPFDATGTASWTDVTNGINSLYASGATVINASLGVPGSVLSPEWANILTNLTAPTTKGPANTGANQLVIVKAAGNEGVTQTTDVPWVGNSAPDNLILVGSVGPNGTISSFSNTPGEACILVNSVCTDQNKLKYRFLVAPGENILVGDGNGGVTRMSGTSFAAPLVTGAIALLQDRWPWLQQHAAETVQIILQSARDLGAPGVDPVYGWGELDVQASQSPLNFNNLVVYQPVNTVQVKGAPPSGPPNTSQISTTSLKSSLLDPGQLALWQTQGAYITAIEPIGTTYRDFTIPLSSLLVGKTQAGQANPYQSYLYQRLINWAAGSSSYTNFNSTTAPISQGDWSVSMVATPAAPDEQHHGGMPFHSEFLLANHMDGTELRVGEGNGAYALTANSAFAFRTDFNPSTGGVNPVLGLASGGAYARGAIALGTTLHVNFGITEKSDSHATYDPNLGAVRIDQLPTSNATASVVGIDYTPLRSLTFSSTYTMLHEDTGLLGAQGSGALSLPNGAATQAATVGATLSLRDGWTLSGSATAATTTAPQNGRAALNLVGNALRSTAEELVVAKTGVFGGLDWLRISLTQPLHIEGGALQYTSYEVTDRATGTLGLVSHTWHIAGNREYRAEALYGISMLDNRAEFDGFGVLDANPLTAPGTALSATVGAQFRVTW